MSDLRLTTYPGEVITVVETRVEELQRQVDELKAALEKIRASRTRHSVFDPVTALNENIQIAKAALDKL